MKATFRQRDFFRLAWRGPKKDGQRPAPDGTVLFTDWDVEPETMERVERIHFLTPDRREPGRLFHTAEEATTFFKKSGYCSPDYVTVESYKQ